MSSIAGPLYTWHASHLMQSNKTPEIVPASVCAGTGQHVHEKLDKILQFMSKIRLRCQPEIAMT